MTSCHGHTGKVKLRFPTREEAVEYRRAHRQIGDKALYQCPDCGGWHMATRLKRAIKRGWKNATRNT